MIRPHGLFGGSLALAAVAGLMTIQRPDAALFIADPLPERPEREPQMNSVTEATPGPFASRCLRDKPGGRAAQRRLRQRWPA
ncbi:hypothetical protein [Prosthecomicrobium hirschii]|uniref:hypothetical protein n=1 Tax=Prosthecodimorpha hirschii TaxID=665126 RepID=UPI0022207223|nr:hypothetical protein [Prosthecomicrobium hirschii]MCW1844142.1 hypothetical protein [Prosthecomicrobium hirschii]